MHRCAVFVDAGYLFAQGSTLLTGQRQPRETISLTAPAVIQALKEVSQAAASLPLLRIYWYDGMRAGRQSREQAEIADLDDVKLRVGQINSVGEQKGVDALIVTDMMELARNRAISDAILLSGDEDVRVGVVLAQQFGVRVHLIGIQPARGNQARSLMQEADTTREWDAAIIGGFMAYVPPAAPVAAITTSPIGATTAANLLDPIVEPMVMALDAADLATLKAIFGSSSMVPKEHDQSILRAGRMHYGQQTLSNPEKSALRTTFVRLVLSR